MANIVKVNFGRKKKPQPRQMPLSGTGGNAARGKVKKSPASRPTKKTPRAHKPAEMTLEQWQIALRREFGREQSFEWRNVGKEPIFSEFSVRNPASGGEYRVSIRGANPGANYCSCPDFSVNTLGTCKHIEFMLSRLERKRGAKKALAVGFHPPHSEVALRYGARRDVVFRSGTACPASVLRLASEYFDEGDVLKQESLMQFDRFLKEVAAGGHEVRCYDDALGLIAEARDQVRLRDRVDKSFPDGTASARFDGLLRTQLYPYQRQGALFAARTGRCLIADDMGLGKTIQAIAAAEILAMTVGIERVLVITPTSLKFQWKQEIEKFTKRAAQTVEGLLHARKACYRTDSFYKITNYDVIHRDASFIRDWAPDLIILDEAQRIKNWKTRAAQTVKKLVSPYAIVLTGTPLENRLEELHSIVEFVDRFHLGPLYRFLYEHQHTDECGRVIGYKNLSAVSSTLAPVLIRRNKSEVLKDLPERLDKHFFLPMTPEQMNHHEENREIVARIVQKWRKYKFLSEADQRRLTIALQYMRMSCNSTYLIDPATDYGVKADELAVLLNEMFEQPDTKVVVFSQWVGTHQLLMERFKARKWGHVLFHGGVPGPQRKDLVRQFKEDPECRIFLSTDAGGVGLNLQHASVVVNMDQPWNPAVLEQRIGRVHRLGQHRPVQVIHFVSQGTIEHGMLDILKFKKSLFSGVLEGGQDEVFLGGTKLKRFMESVESVSTCIPSPMPAQDELTLADSQKVEADEASKRVAASPSEAQPQPREATGERPASGTASVAAATVRTPATEAWAACVSAGISFFEKLGQALSTDSEKSGAGTGVVAPGLPLPIVERDEATGKQYVKFPMPKPEIIQQAAGLLGSLVGLLKAQSE